MKTFTLLLFLLPWLVFAQDPLYESQQQGLLQPYNPNAYGPGINADATGRPFHWQTQQGQPVAPMTPVQPDAYGPGVGMDVYGRPVYPKADY